MRVLTTRASWRGACDELRADANSIGFVPTMGALHAGHASLLAEAARRCDVVVLSIFVNPLQFGERADLEHYPRPLEADLALAERSGCELIFTPAITEIYPGYPALPATKVSVAGPALGFEGTDRPGHFDGVATVVTMLFELTGPCTAFFGEKDFQQLAVVRQMVLDLGMPVELIGCPTVRESDGLALSSRNVRLSGQGRRAALVLSRALAEGAEVLGRGGSGAEAEAVMYATVAAEPAATLFYAAVVDPVLLTPVRSLRDVEEVRLLIAAEIEGVRLIDNAPVLGGAAS